MEKRDRRTPGGKVHRPETVMIPELEELCGHNRRPYSPEDDAILAEYYPRGVPVNALAKHLDRTPDAIRNRILRLDIRRG